jgi:hypothetical protein
MAWWRVVTFRQELELANSLRSLRIGGGQFSSSTNSWGWAISFLESLKMVLESLRMVGTGRSVLSFSQELGLGHLLIGKLRMVRRTILSFSQELELSCHPWDKSWSWPPPYEDWWWWGRTVLPCSQELKLGHLHPRKPEDGGKDCSHL